MASMGLSSCVPWSTSSDQVCTEQRQEAAPIGMFWVVFLAFAVGHTCPSVLTVAHKRALFRWGIAPLAAILVFDYTTQSAIAPALLTVLCNTAATFAPFVSALSRTISSWASHVPSGALYIANVMTNMMWSLLPVATIMINTMWSALHAAVGLISTFVEVFPTVAAPLIKLLSSAVWFFCSVTSLIASGVTLMTTPIATFASTLVSMTWSITSSIFYLTTSSASTDKVATTDSSFLGVLVGQAAYYAAFGFVWLMIACLFVNKLSEIVDSVNECILDGMAKLFVAVLPSRFVEYYLQDS